MSHSVAPSVAGAVVLCGYGRLCRAEHAVTFADGRSSFNWLTGSSIDPLMDYTVSSSDSSSSSLLFAHKKSEKAQRSPLKLVGPDFGKKRLGLPGDEVDNKAKGKVSLLKCI